MHAAVISVADISVKDSYRLFGALTLAPANQHRRSLRVFEVRRPVQRGGAITLTGVYVGALLEQQPERLRVATLNRIGEGAVSGGR